MNCKPGDLAVVIAHEGPGDVGVVGRIVEVLQAGSDWSDCGDARHHWICRDVSGRPLPFQNPNGSAGSGYATEIPDTDLRPIRDQDGDDETLTWAGKPEQVTA